MPLTIRLKPDERVIIGGAVIRNGGHASVFYVENQVPILRRKDILSEAEAMTPARQVYFELQLIYIDAERRDVHKDMLSVLAKDILEQPRPALHILIYKILDMVSEENYYHALKVARELINCEDSSQTS